MLDQNHQNLTPFHFNVDILHKNYQGIEKRKGKSVICLLKTHEYSF